MGIMVSGREANHLNDEKLCGLVSCGSRGVIMRLAERAHDLNLRHLSSPSETARSRDLLLYDQVVDPSESR